MNGMQGHQLGDAAYHREVEQLYLTIADHLSARSNYVNQLAAKDEEIERLKLDAAIGRVPLNQADEAYEARIAFAEEQLAAAQAENEWLKEMITKLNEGNTVLMETRHDAEQEVKELRAKLKVAEEAIRAA
jgi:chromosome segregation ATPase